MLNVEYLTNRNGQTKAIVIPIEIWNKLFPKEDISIEQMAEGIEDYCLGKAMDEAKDSPTLNREEALDFLED